MTYVLVIVSGGLIEAVKCFSDSQMAIKSLARYAKTMDITVDEAAVYSAKGMLVNAKQFLDDM